MLTLNVKREGDVRCNRIIHFRSKEPGDKTHPVIQGYININATSGNVKWRGLSPMKLGPFYLRENKIVTPWYLDGLHPGFFPTNDDTQTLYCTNLENIWQGSKVFNVDLDINKIIQTTFYERRREMANDPQPHRRALPKAKANVVCAYWNGHILSYLDSRLIYCELYSGLVKETTEYQELVNMKQNGVNLQILGYDGQNLPIDESMRKACLDAAKPFGKGACPSTGIASDFGHELVLCCLLKGITPWRSIWL